MGHCIEKNRAIYSGLGLSLILFGFVTSCLSFGLGSGEGGKEFCPSVILLPDANRQIKFSSDGDQDLTNIVYISRIESAKVECDVDFENQTLDAEFRITLSVETGTAAQKNGMIRYFIAIITAHEKILTRKTYTRSFELVSGQSRVLLTEAPILQQIPYKMQDRIASADRFIVGFELNPLALQFNRENHDWLK